MMLLKKPEKPVLFGRMLDAWLEEKEREALKPSWKSGPRRGRRQTGACWRFIMNMRERKPRRSFS